MYNIDLLIIMFYEWIGYNLLLFDLVKFVHNKYFYLYQTLFVYLPGKKLFYLNTHALIYIYKYIYIYTCIYMYIIYI